MDSSILPGRFTVDLPEHTVVFIIGARINKRRAVHKWLPVIAAMPPMIKEIQTHKELGCLSMESFFGLRTTLMVQYWRSEKELMTYAKGPKHLAAWKNFIKKTAQNDAVGIYHETYLIKKGQAEAIYVNMPEFGLSKAFERTAVTSRTHSAQQRLTKK